MFRERALKVLLVLLGLIFLASIYPIAGGVRHAGAPGEDSGDTMMLSIYFALGIFLLLAVRNPSEHRSLIAFAGWANIAHATVMALMSIRFVSERSSLLMAALGFGVIGLALLALAPRKRAPHSSRFSIRGPRRAAFARWGGMSGKRSRDSDRSGFSTES